MSNYRDDMNVTAIVSDELYSGLSDAGESTGFISSVLLFGLSLLLTEAALASDEIYERIKQSPIIETVTVSENVFQTSLSNSIIVENSNVSDTLSFTKIFTLSEESVSATDNTFETIGVLTQDNVGVSDQVDDARKAYQLVSDLVRGDGLAFGYGSNLVDEVFVASDEASLRLRGKALSIDTAFVSDDLIELVSNRGVIVESARWSDSVSDRLSAKQLVSDELVIWDEGFHAPTVTAWTACTNEWSLSRYAPFKGNSITLINGVFYIATDEGVFALDGTTETIHAELRTGRMKLGEEINMADNAYINYELDGTASLMVMQTLEGQSSYTYPLESGASPVPTAGRFKLGRGIKDKYLTFKLVVDGVRCAITDLYVSSQKFTRRIK